MKIQHIILAVFAITLFAAGWFLKPMPKPEIRTEVQYVDRFITKRDTVTEQIPVTRIVYRETIKRDTVTISKPVELEKFKLISPAPVRFSGKNMVLTAYDPQANRWQQDYYAIPMQKWHGGLYWISGIGLQKWNNKYMVNGIRIMGGYKRVSLYADMQVRGLNENGWLSAGLMIKLR